MKYGMEQSTGRSMEEVEQVITDLESMKENHVHWAEYFEANPYAEQEHVDTGEWDSAKIHREYVAKYDRIINLIRRLSGEDRDLRRVNRVKKGEEMNNGRKFR